MRRLQEKHPRAIRWMHWINFPVLFLMIWSGLLIYWANSVYRVGLGSFTLFQFFPDRFFNFLGVGHRLSEGLALHFFFMWFFAINGVIYVLYTAISGEWRYLLPNRKSFSEALRLMLHDLHLSNRRTPQRKFNGAQQIAYTGVIFMGAGSVLTGVAILRPVQFAWLSNLLGGYEWARWEHFWLAIGYCLFFVVHVAQVIKAGWNNFRAMVTGYELVTVEPGPSDTNRTRDSLEVTT